MSDLGETTPSPLLGETQRLLEVTSVATGEDFYRALASGVAECLGVKFCMVGHHVPGDTSTVRLRAVFGEGRFLPSFDYQLAGTPCENVHELGLCHFPSRAAHLFPRDVMLAEMGIDSYLALRVTAPSGRAGGIILALHDAPTADLPKEMVAVLALLARRVSSEFEREHAEVALRESEARYRRIVDTCLEGVWGVDRDGHTSFVNTRMATMLGRTPEEMMGRHLFDFMDAAGRAIATVNLARRKSGISEHHEFKLQRKDGSDVWTIMATNPVLDGEGAYAGAMALVTDLTERRELEARVLQAQKLESLGVLAGGIAHDFNNILVGILGNAGLALMDTPEEAPVTPLLEDIQEAAHRLSDLTRQMLAYSGKGRFVVERIDVGSLVTEARHLLSAVVSKNATLALSLGSEPLYVEGDAAQIRQVVMNLVTNASDAVHDRGGTVRLSTGVVWADHERLRSTFLAEPLAEGEYVFLVVEDDGVGMTPPVRERIFDPFFTTKFTGRGLGLAAVLGILRAHRGAVRVESEEGRGSRFEVLLPRTARPERSAVSEREIPAAAIELGGVVLVADDEPRVRDMARRLLESAGFEVLVACDGVEAVEIAEREGARLTLALVDLTMPRLGGEEVFRRLQTLRPELPVVLSSGYDEHETTSRFATGALAGFLQKPWSPVELNRVVGAALARRR